MACVWEALKMQSCSYKPAATPVIASIEATRMCASTRPRSVLKSLLASSLLLAFQCALEFQAGAQSFGPFPNTVDASLIEGFSRCREYAKE